MAKRNAFPRGGGGGMNMQGMMQQAQKMQQNIARVQAELEEAEIEASAGGGAVKVVVTGKKVLKSLSISPEAVDPQDVEMLEDLILAAVNEAMHKVDTYSEEQMAKATGGMNLGGLI